MRKSEINNFTRMEQNELTQAVPLCIAPNLGEDWVLDIWMCSLHGRAIEEETRSALVEDWEPILGAFIYTAMKTSNARKMEENTGQVYTNAVRVYCPNSDICDGKLSFTMAFDAARVLWVKAYSLD
jgi:hypothetical protein